MLTSRQLNQFDRLEKRLRALVKAWRANHRNTTKILGESKNQFNAEFIRGAVLGTKAAAQELELALKEK